MMLMGRNAHASARLHRLGIATAVAVLAALLAVVISIESASLSILVVVASIESTVVRLFAS